VAACAGGLGREQARAERAERAGGSCGSCGSAPSGTDRREIARWTLDGRVGRGERAADGGVQVPECPATCRQRLIG
jgi:hypothetical protein